MLNKIKILLPSPNSNYVIFENEKYKKEVLFVYRLYLFKNINMLSEDEISNYLNSINMILKNNQTNFTTILNTKESSAVDYVENIQKLLNKAKETDEKIKRLILLSQVDLILKKIGEHKNYFYIVFSDYYDTTENLEIFYNQKIISTLRLIKNFHFYEELNGKSLVGFLNEFFSISSKNKIYINEKNINKLFK